MCEVELVGRLDRGCSVWRVVVVAGHVPRVECGRAALRVRRGVGRGAVRAARLHRRALHRRSVHRSDTAAPGRAGASRRTVPCELATRAIKLRNYRWQSEMRRLGNIILLISAAKQSWGPVLWMKQTFTINCDVGLICQGRLKHPRAYHIRT